MNKINGLPPFKRFCVTIGNLPSSYVDSMSYYECVMWLCKFLQEKVIPAINENAEAVNELINWFNNLDVQEEINHKLDEMVETGELQEIISEYLNSTAVFGFDTVSDMIASENLINGSYARTIGYNTKNDGGAGLYKIRTITNEDTVDGGRIIGMNDETLVAELIIEDSTISPNQYGAIGDGITDDTIYIQKALDSGLNVKFVSNYAFTHLVFNFNNYNVDGNYKALFYIGDGSQSEAILFEAHHSYLKNFRVINSTDSTIPCMRWRSYNNSSYSQFDYFTNIKIYNFELAIFYGISEVESINVPQSENYIDNLKTRGCHRVIYCNQPNGHLFITNSIVKSSHNEELYTYNHNTSCIAECINGALHINNSVLLNAADSNGTGLKGHGFDISNCNYEIAGTNFDLDGNNKILNLSGGYKGNAETHYINIRPNENNTDYTVIIDNIEMGIPTNTANIPYIKNNNKSNGKVIINNSTFKGNLINSQKSFSQCYGNIVNSYRNNLYHNFNEIEINAYNYKNYLNIPDQYVTISDEYINVNIPSGGASFRLEGTFDKILELVSDIENISANTKFTGTISKVDGTSFTLSRAFDSDNLTNIYLNDKGFYKYIISLYSSSSNIQFRFKKIILRGNNLIAKQLLS